MINCLRRALLLLVPVLLYQIMAAPLFDVDGVRPHFIWIAVAFVALHSNRKQFWVSATALGVALDLLSVDPLGIHLVTTWVFGGILFRAASAGWTESSALTATLLAVALLLSTGLAAAVAVLCDGVVLGGFWWRGTGLALVQSCWITLYTWLLVWPVFTVLRTAQTAIAEERLQHMY